MSTDNLSTLVIDRHDVMTKCMDPGSTQIGDRQDKRNRLKYKICQTAFIVLGPIVMGLFLELIGPTLPDLMHKVNSNYEAISRTLVVRSAGHIISSITGGIISSKLKDDAGAFLSLAFLLGAIGTIAAPWCDRLVLLTLCLLLQGLANGTIDTLSTFLCTRLWEEKAAVPLHALHFGYGVGALIAPQLALPFIAQHIPFINSTSNSVSQNTSFTQERGMYTQTADVTPLMNITMTGASVPSRHSQIEIPYGISGSFAVILCISFSVFHMRETYMKNRKTYHNIPNSGKGLTQPAKRKWLGCCNKDNDSLHMLYLAVMFLTFFNCNGVLNAFSKFLYIFATEGDLQMSHTMAASLNSAFWLAFTVGRGLGLVLSRWISPNIMLCAEVIVNVISGVLLFIWGDSVPLMLWINSCVFGLSMGPVIPTAFACANLYTRLNGTVVSVFFISVASGPLVSQWLTGYLFQLYGPKVHMPITLGYTIATAALLIIMCLLIRNKRKRFDEVLEIAVSLDDKKTPAEIPNNDTKAENGHLSSGHIISDCDRLSDKGSMLLNA